MAVKSVITDCEIIGYGHREDTLKRAIQVGAIDRGTGDFRSAVEGSDLVILCTPVGLLAEMLRGISGFVKAGAIVTDVGNDPLELVRLDESLSMAFLVLLERLTPMERAVFLLREVFEYEYDEVAAMLGKNEANCRQVLRRAKQHIQAMRPRFKISRAKQSDLLERFLKAAVTGDTAGLIALLANDVELRSDGGGKGVAVPNVVRGSDNVARGVVGALNKLLPGYLVRKVASINGRPGVVSYRNGKPHSVLTLETDGERISTIYVVTNPEKLVHVPETVN